ncbi:MAG: ATP-dependent sacrificial sulfur transferase LarE [Phycisphaerae bacterium]|nr:ATP-dependent sacrificial sulfur transferase LarE [Phycisphaerae bacterium]
MADEFTVTDETSGKLAALRAELKKMGSLLVAFSGGVDSSFLLAVAIETLGPEKVLAVTAKSATYPAGELPAAQALAAKLAVNHQIIETCELDDPHYAENPPQRCYFCKMELLTKLRDIAEEHGYSVVATAANADDTGDFRPGLRAGDELGIARPLQKVGLSKNEIRALSRQMDLPSWDKPSMACLASRFPYGQRLTTEALARVEAAEDFLTVAGFSPLRVRSHDTMARIEISPGQFAKLLDEKLREKIVARLKQLGYIYITFDLQGFRSGSMNEPLSDEQKE